VSTVLIIGGGLAGLAAATALAPRGFRVTVLESRNRLGGRAGSFTDPSTGQLVDACQHVSMGCCTNFRHFYRTVGMNHWLRPQPCLYFITPDRRVSRFKADHWPAPFHLARSFLAAHFLTVKEKIHIARGLALLRSANHDEDPPFVDWLVKSGQTPSTIDRFWGVVLTSALNETPDRVGLRYARKVFLDGFLSHRRGFEVEVPVVPLGRLYGEELQKWFANHGIRLQLNAGVKSIRIVNQRVHGLDLRDGDFMQADWYLSAVPFDRLLDLLSAEVINGDSYFSNLRRLETSPITSVHLWYDRPIMNRPNLVLIGCLGQWIFNRGQVAPGEYYFQVVVSAARQFRSLGHGEIQRRVVEELQRLFPEAQSAKLLRARVITEQSATFSAVPGVDQWRPVQASPIRSLYLAGDWTTTGWPATMEGAVRSGYLAAEALLERLERKERLVQPDL
jgi:squalene-associated FAD-dependent desaturase